MPFLYDLFAGSIKRIPDCSSLRILYATTSSSSSSNPEDLLFYSLCTWRMAREQLRFSLISLAWKWGSQKVTSCIHSHRWLRRFSSLATAFTKATPGRNSTTTFAKKWMRNKQHTEIHGTIKKQYIIWTIYHIPEPDCAVVPDCSTTEQWIEKILTLQKGIYHNASSCVISTNLRQDWKV